MIILNLELTDNPSESANSQTKDLRSLAALPLLLRLLQCFWVNSLVEFLFLPSSTFVVSQAWNSSRPQHTSSLKLTHPLFSQSHQNYFRPTNKFFFYFFLCSLYYYGHHQNTEQQVW